MTAVSDRDRILDAAAEAHARAIARGMRVLELFARLGRPFGANDIRGALDDLGVPAASRGALFNAAIRAGLIERIDWENSTKRNTHGKPVALYVGRRTA